MEVVRQIIFSLAYSVFLFALFAAIFALLTAIWPCNKNIRWWRREALMTDATYWLIVPLFTRVVKIALLALGAGLLFGFSNEEALAAFYKEGHGPLRELPMWVQMLAILLISDFLFYGIHRMFHAPKWWRIHAIHHSSKDLDWLGMTRFHPLNTWLEFTLVDTIMLLVGFSPMAMITLAPLNTIYSAFVHANLRWTFGPFKYVLASPVFHRWHHTSVKEGGEKNYAPTFPFIDLMFGTFYMPEGKLPEAYGVSDKNFPDGFLAQMVYPFKKPNKKKDLSTDSADPGQTTST